MGQGPLSCKPSRRSDYDSNSSKKVFATTAEILQARSSDNVQQSSPRSCFKPMACHATLTLLAGCAGDTVLAGGGGGVTGQQVLKSP